MTTAIETLSAVGITAGYDGPPILDGVAVSVRSGEIAVILGPNGAGKSTLAKAMMGLLKVTSGHVRFNDSEVTGLGPHKLIRKGIAYLPQLGGIFDAMSVVENLEMGGYILKSGVRERITELLDMFPDLAVDRHKRAGTLSGGQQRMLAMARMLMTQPRIAVLDEPTAGLSPLYAERVWEQIARVRALGVGMLVVEQNAQMAFERADTVFLLAQGRNVLDGTPADLAETAEVTRILVG
ncbi:MAG TPA: ABC transporter ATP-binding protein [Jatrophihabitans sp.]